MASNTTQAQSVLMRPDDQRPGPLRDENFKQLVLTQHVQYMDERNIDVQIIGPRPFIMLGWMPNYDILVSWTRLTNDAIGKQVSFFPDRFLTSCQLPQNCHAEDTKHVLDEIDRCKKEWGLMSVYVGPDPEGLRQTPGMDKPYWYPLYEKCEREGLPIIIHGTNHQDPRLTIINQNYQVGFLVEQFIATRLSTPSASNASH
jgi:predicted TIM-barrel fold metal-dependent hydrolase